MPDNAERLEDPHSPEYFPLNNIRKVRSTILSLRDYIENPTYFDETDLIEIGNALLKSAWPNRTDLLVIPPWKR